MIRFVALCDDPLDLPGILTKVQSEDLGGVVVFSGEVRARTGDHETRELLYEAHRPMAEAQMKRIADEESERFDANVAIVHRVGRLIPGDTAVVCVAATAHRAEAFECCRRLIDRTKQDVPIWKKEFGPAGEEWVS